MSAATTGVRPVEEQGLRGLRLTRRGKVVVGLLCLLLMAVVLGISTQAMAGTPAQGIEVETVTVQPGQSLWNFAAKVAGPDEDIRNVVDEIQALNGLSDVSLMAGQKLYLPVRSMSN